MWITYYITVCSSLNYLLIILFWLIIYVALSFFRSPSSDMEINMKKLYCFFRVCLHIFYYYLLTQWLGIISSIGYWQYKLLIDSAVLPPDWSIKRIDVTNRYIPTVIVISWNICTIYDDQPMDTLMTSTASDTFNDINHQEDKHDGNFEKSVIEGLSAFDD